MSKITIIGLGLIGNSIGMALKRANAGGQSMEIVGFDPDRSQEEAALRKYGSVDTIAPNLEQAVRGAQLVVISTPASAAREVLSAISPLLDEGATVTDTLPNKEQVMAWAGEVLGPSNSFVSGHPFSRSTDLETPPEDAEPNADLFRNAPYCLIPLRTTTDIAFSNVIGFVETLGANPLFIDPQEHDSFLAAVSHIPIVASSALLRMTTKSPTWTDMRGLAQGYYKTATEAASADPAALSDALLGNRQSLLRWIDQYQIALGEMRDIISRDDRSALLSVLSEARNAREDWVLQNKGVNVEEIERRAAMREAIEETSPARTLMGSALSNRFFRRKDKEKQRED